MSNYCDNCKYRGKLEYSTINYCSKYDEVLDGEPPVRSDKCKSETETKEKSKKKKDYIEVK